MRLHENKKLFLDVMIAISTAAGIRLEYVEKDYYMSLLVSEGMKRIPGLVFKGGTSLSKCYKVIKRFSEDIDFSLDEDNFNRKNRTFAKYEILEMCKDLGFKVKNEGNIKNNIHHTFARYQISYDSVVPNRIEEPEILLEMSYIQKTFPCKMSTITSYIGEYLLDDECKDIAKEYGLEEKQVRVQSLERTLIDKVFAICDYSIDGRYERNSRHIYDIYKLLDLVDIYSPEMKDLVKRTREARKSNDRSYSSQDGFDVPQKLREIIWDQEYKNDYQSRTEPILYEDVHYEEAIKGLEKVIDSKLFEEKEKYYGRERNL